AIWSTAGNWDPSSGIPNSAGDIVTFNFLELNPTPLTVTLNASVTVGQMHLNWFPFNSGAFLTINGQPGAGLILNNGASRAKLAGKEAFIINTPVNITNGLDIENTNLAAFSGPVSGVGGIHINNAGGARFFAPMSFTGGINVTADQPFITTSIT